MRHVLVIGKPTGGPGNADTETVAKRVTSPNVIVRRCASSAELVPTLKDIVSDNILIDVLDIFDHAAAGTQVLGDDILFRSDEDPETPLKGDKIADAIRPYLSEFARVRLLGCYSAGERAGRLLLFKLARILLGRRLVFGTNGGVDQKDFDEGGFMVARDVSYLVDSLGAIDAEAVGHNQRSTNYVSLLP